MPKAHTIDYVKNFIESVDGYSLISEEYKSATKKILIKCNSGHLYWQTFDHFKRGHRCPQCAGNKKYTQEEIENFINKEDYKLLSLYKGSNNKITILCPNGHQWCVTFNHFKNGVRCPYCQGLKKKTFKEVNDIIEKEGYTLLSDSYLGNSFKLRIKCPNNHEYDVTFNNFQNGQRCKKCFIEYFRGENHPRWNPNKNKISRIRRSKEYLLWREDVLERDKHTCQICGSKSNLHVHHLDSFTHFPKKRLDINNGIVLCKNCHDFNIDGSFHNIYGTYYNTKKQFENYLLLRNINNDEKVIKFGS